MAICLGGVPFYLFFLSLFERAASWVVGTPVHPRGVGVEACGVGAAPGGPCWRGEGSRATECSRLAALKSRAESLEERTVSS